ncbi:MAG TPA: 5-formyltetrahydrofolate cyclo-ligase [bacterium]|nr:5-formyltetrahydrofolate cyclo-ligase [bacterium]HPJ72676.1 5-formyltetrahydrofolate cyclo-ligase [bacterium]HPQ66183.1 5-formyltetrahydrofolate cyclo-ligase [bacterium]
MKAELRRDLLARRCSLSPEENAVKSKRIASKLLGLPEFGTSRTVFIYSATGSEVKTESVMLTALKLGKRVAVPAIDLSGRLLRPVLISDPARELDDRCRGCPQPPPGSCVEVPAEEVDLAVVPGVGFDGRGARLGRGGGYYDEFLGHWPRIFRVALAFQCQIVDRLPVSGHDQPIDVLITENRVVRIRPPRLPMVYQEEPLTTEKGS